MVCDKLFLLWQLMFPIVLFLCFFHSCLSLEYVYDRAICTGFGDRMGDLMSLATMARLQSVRVVFEWCQDPSIIFSRVHQHIPKFNGWKYDLPEFMERFLPPSEISIVSNLSVEHKKSPYKVKYEGLPVPSEAGLNMVYTTSYDTFQLKANVKRVDPHVYKNTYKSITLPIANHIKKGEDPYIVLHMRGPDHNTYTPFLNSHDHPSLYCTKKVLRKIVEIDIFKIYVITNNMKWLYSLIKPHQKLNVLNGTSAYDDFALLLGSSAIVQHALHGWSAYSSVASMMASIPLITTYKRTHEHHRYNILSQYGNGVPSEFYSCDQLHSFLSHVMKDKLYL